MKEIQSKELCAIGLLAITAGTCILSSSACNVVSPITLTILAYLLGRDAGFVKGRLK